MELVHQEAWKVLSSDRTLQMLRQHQTDHFVESQRNMCWCPNPKCDAAVQIQGAGDDVRCGQCGFRFCFKCGAHTHLPATCEEVDRWARNCEKDKGTAQWLLSNTKKCPRCNTYTERSFGCNHMTCVKCGYEYCWHCLRPWKVHGEHTGGFYECNLPVDGEQQQALGEDDMQRFVSYYRHYKTFENFQKLSERRCHLLLASQPAFAKGPTSPRGLETTSLFTAKDEGGADRVDDGLRSDREGSFGVSNNAIGHGEATAQAAARANAGAGTRKRRKGADVDEDDDKDALNLGSALTDLFHAVLSSLTLWRLHCRQAEVAFCLMIFVARRAGISAETLEVFFCSMGVTGASTFMEGSKQVRALRKMIRNPTPLYVMINCLLDEAEIRAMTAATASTKKARATASKTRSQSFVAVNNQGIETFVSVPDTGGTARASRSDRFSASTGLVDGWGFSKTLPVYEQRPLEQLRSAKGDHRDISQYFSRAHSANIGEMSFPENWMDLLSACIDYETDLLATVDATLLCSCSRYDASETKEGVAGTTSDGGLAWGESKIEDGVHLLESKIDPTDKGPMELMAHKLKSSGKATKPGKLWFAFDPTPVLFRDNESIRFWPAVGAPLPSPSPSSSSLSSSSSSSSLSSSSPSSRSLRSSPLSSSSSAPVASCSLLDSNKQMTRALHEAVCACCSATRCFENMEDDPELELRGEHPLTKVLGSPSKFTLTAVNLDSYTVLEAREVNQSHLYKLKASDVYSKSYAGDGQVPGPLCSILPQACDFCGCNPIIGDAYRCTVCEGVNICAHCYHSGSRAGAPAHVAAHVFVRRRRAKMHMNFRSINVHSGLIPPLGTRALVPLEKSAVSEGRGAIQQTAVVTVSENINHNLEQWNVTVRHTARSFDGYRLRQDLLPPLYHEFEDPAPGVGNGQMCSDSTGA